MANNNNTKNLNVPNLRFPEFKGEWRFSSLRRECDILCGYPFDGQAILEKSGNVKLLRGINITEGEIRHSDELDRYYSGDILKLKKYILCEGDLVLSMDGSKVGRNSAILTNLENGAYLVQRICRIRSQKHDVKYIFQHINNSRFHQYVDSVKTASAIPHISQSDIQNYIIPFPPTHEEQIKITNLLSLLDEHIATQSKIIEKYESLIKGIRYYILQESTHYNYLGNLCNIIKGQQVNLDNLLKHGKYYVMNGGIQPSGYYNLYNTDAGTISISEGGNSCGYVQYNKENFWSGGHCYTLQNIKGELTEKYLYHYLKSNEKMIMALRVGSGLPNIQKRDLMSLRIPIPAKENQKKISCLLDSIEDKISVETNVLKYAIKQKNYLLRQMFI